MKVLATLGLIALTACDADPVTAPSPPTPAPYFRILHAVDSVNAALRDFHAEGGRLVFVYTVFFPADTTMPPYIAISLKRP